MKTTAELDQTRLRRLLLPLSPGDQVHLDEVLLGLIRWRFPDVIDLMFEYDVFTRQETLSWWRDECSFSIRIFRDRTDSKWVDLMFERVIAAMRSRFRRFSRDPRRYV